MAQIYVDEASRYYTIREDGETSDGASWRRGDAAIVKAAESPYFH